ncbi:hypothetical protein P353_23470 [Comamonas testosteroni]|uniref:Uncharacterized protein n=1 Tax=Comamonas testosteroni TaxID=285 RepID=A0A096F6X3_COMTE|nr:hypothetical protein P353_23470 [Comamonas testosteroni]
MLMEVSLELGTKGEVSLPGRIAVGPGIRWH